MSRSELAGYIVTRLVFVLALIDSFDPTHELLNWWQWALLIFLSGLVVSFVWGFCEGVGRSIKRARSTR